MPATLPFHSFIKGTELRCNQHWRLMLRETNIPIRCAWLRADRARERPRLLGLPPWGRSGTTTVIARAQQASPSASSTGRSPLNLGPKGSLSLELQQPASRQHPCPKANPSCYTCALPSTQLSLCPLLIPLPWSLIRVALACRALALPRLPQNCCHLPCPAALQSLACRALLCQSLACRALPCHTPATSMPCAALMRASHFKRWHAAR